LRSCFDSARETKNHSRGCRVEVVLIGDRAAVGIHVPGVHDPNNNNNVQAGGNAKRSERRDEVICSLAKYLKNVFFCFSFVRSREIIIIRPLLLLLGS
jgi:hypothetical protein